MKKLVFLMPLFLIVFIQFIHGQEIETKTKDELLQLGDSNEEIITRYNSISFFVDTLFFKTSNPQNEYFVNLNIRYYSWLDNNPKGEPVYQIGCLFKKIILKGDNIGYLTDLRLSPNVTLNDINHIEVEVKLRRIPQKEDNITNVLSTVIEKTITENIGLGLINRLLESNASDDSTDILAFRRDFTIPLNFLQYEKLRETDSLRLLKNNERIGIPISSDIQVSILKGGLLKGVFKKVAAVIKGVGVTQNDISDQRIDYNGMMQIYFTKDENPVIPAEIQKCLVKIRSASSLKLKRMIDEVAELRTYIDNSNVSNEMKFTLSEYCTLAECYALSRTIKPKDWNSRDIEDNLVTKFKAVLSDMEAHAKNNRFKPYKVTNISEKHPEKPFIIYYPYALDETSLRDFIKWQIELASALESINN
ncbi:MAG: hypothetical protein LBO74_01015 [Candidatus Symbiothrix sp.]|jgi:hypothetical protein|nr:hypothetical protein [Candidatus Symbiothrix sp.]